jgi:hypothetical protein
MNKFLLQRENNVDISASLAWPFGHTEQLLSHRTADPYQHGELYSRSQFRNVTFRHRPRASFIDVVVVHVGRERDVRVLEAKRWRPT